MAAKVHLSPSFQAPSAEGTSIVVAEDADLVAARLSDAKAGGDEPALVEFALLNGAQVFIAADHVAYVEKVKTG